MTSTWNSKAIVLRYFPHKEHDRVYSVYTEQFGKQHMRAMGVLKLTSKLAGSLEPFAEIDVYMIQSKLWPKIGGAVVTHRFTQLTENIAKNNAAWFVCDVLDRTTQDNIPDAEVYQLLYATLTWLDLHSSHRTILYSYIIKLSALLGYRIEQDCSGEVLKIIQWLKQEEYEQVQRLRIKQQQWNELLTTVRIWLEDVAGERVQTERFLV